jgi:uncharacterized cupin superfamily protein
MQTVKDVIVRKPTAEEIEVCKKWPIWQCATSTFDWEYTETETCLILEGKVTVTDKTSSVNFAAGDLVIFPCDLACTWHVKEDVRKHYSFS